MDAILNDGKYLPVKLKIKRRELSKTILEAGCGIAASTVEAGSDKHLPCFRSYIWKEFFYFSPFKKHTGIASGQAGTAVSAMALPCWIRNGRWSRQPTKPMRKTIGIIANKTNSNMRVYDLFFSGCIMRIF